MSKRHFDDEDEFAPLEGREEAGVPDEIVETEEEELIIADDDATRSPGLNRAARPASKTGCESSCEKASTRRPLIRASPEGSPEAGEKERQPRKANPRTQPRKKKETLKQAFLRLWTGPTSVRASSFMIRTVKPVVFGTHGDSHSFPVQEKARHVSPPGPSLSY